MDWTTNALLRKSCCHLMNPLNYRKLFHLFQHSTYFLFKQFLAQNFKLKNLVWKILLRKMYISEYFENWNFSQLFENGIFQTKILSLKFCARKSKKNKMRRGLIHKRLKKAILMPAEESTWPPRASSLVSESYKIAT